MIYFYESWSKVQNQNNFSALDCERQDSPDGTSIDSQSIGLL